MIIQPTLKLSERIFNGSRFQFLVLNRDETRFFQSNTPYLVISITDPDKPEAEIAESPLLKSVLRLSFDDVGKPSQFVSDSTDIPMNNADAKRVLSFVKEHLAEVKLIVCHCE